MNSILGTQQIREIAQMLYVILQRGRGGSKMYRNMRTYYINPPLRMYEGMFLPFRTKLAIIELTVILCR